MSKKKKAEKRKAKPKAKANGAVSRRAKPKGSNPRSRVLPGLEQIRDRVLDNAHEQMAEGRGLIAKGTLLDNEGKSIALQRMQKNGTRSYKHAGIESIFSPGVDKLRVRLTKDAEDTSSVEGDTNEDLADLAEAGAGNN